MVSNAGGVGDVAVAGQAVAGVAKDKAGEVSSTATGQAAQVASSAADQARRVTGEAVDQARSLVGTAMDSAWQQGEAQTGDIASAIGRLRDQTAALIEGRPEEAPTLAEHGRVVVDRLDQAVRRLETGGLQGAVDDVQRFARRRPMAFLVGAGLAGFATGRLVRARPSATSSAAPSPPAPYPSLPTVAEPTIPVTGGGYGSSVPPPPPAPPAPEHLGRL